MRKILKEVLYIIELIFRAFYIIAFLVNALGIFAIGFGGLYEWMMNGVYDSYNIFVYGPCGILVGLVLCFIAKKFFDDFKDTVNRHKEEKIRAANSKSLRPYFSEPIMDVLETFGIGIENIFQVFGGFRGKVLTPRDSQYKWDALLEAGVKTIIDLRPQKYTGCLETLCNQNNIEYFNYPVCDTEEGLDMMVELFPKFCKIIDRGDFFISCSDGLYSTDIALVVYWAFHARSKGVTIPDIYCHSGKNREFLRIRSVLNDMYTRFVDLAKGDNPYVTEDDLRFQTYGI